MRKQGPDSRDRRPASLSPACQAPRSSPRFSQMAPRYGLACRMLAQLPPARRDIPECRPAEKNGGPQTSAAIMSLDPSLCMRDPKGRGQNSREDSHTARQKTTDYADDGQDPSCDSGCKWLMPRVTESEPSGLGHARAAHQHGKDATDFMRPSRVDFLDQLEWKKSFIFMMSYYM